MTVRDPGNTTQLPMEWFRVVRADDVHRVEETSASVELVRLLGSREVTVDVLRRRCMQRVAELGPRGWQLEGDPIVCLELDGSIRVTVRFRAQDA